MPRFYFKPDQAKAGVVTLDEKESHHAISVLRLEAGEVVDLFDGSGKQFRGIVTGREKGRLLVALDRTQTNAVSQAIQITLAVSVIRSERMEFLIQKACELGVSSIVPMLTQRSIVKLSSERWKSKIRRWEKIALESCKQCGQPAIPSIMPVQSYKSFLGHANESYDRLLIPTLAVKGQRLYEALRKTRPENLLVLIGPEGDFSREEVDLAISHKAIPVGLGPLVLRSETAAIYLLSVLSFFYQN